MADYPADFGYHRKSTVLPPSLQSALKRLGASLREGRVDTVAVATVVEGFCALPVRDFSAASTDIVVCAGLYAESYGRLSAIIDVKVQLESMQRLMGRTPDLAFILIFHGNGHLRQAALEQIDAPLEAPFLLAAVMYRLNDWVPQVRRAPFARAWPISSGFRRGKQARARRDRCELARRDTLTRVSKFKTGHRFDVFRNDVVSDTLTTHRV